MRARIDDIRALDTEPIAIVPEGALDVQSLWATLELPFPVLVDAGGSVAATFGAVSSSDGRPRRLTVVVDENGYVLYRKEGGPSPDDLVATLQALAAGVTLAS